MGERPPGYAEAATPQAPPSFVRSLPGAPEATDELNFDRTRLSAVRRFVGEAAELAGVSGGRRSDVVLAASELAANSILHGGGRGRVRVWAEPDAFVCEVADRGHIDDTSIGRRRPSPDQINGRGLWIVSQVCDQVQVRTGADGSVVRVRMNLN